MRNRERTRESWIVRAGKNQREHVKSPILQIRKLWHRKAFTKDLPELHMCLVKMLSKRPRSQGF